MKLKMVHKNLVLLPGIDGTGRLFEPLLYHLKAPYRAVVVSYPNDRILTYTQLIPYIRDVIPWNEPYIVVGESYGGPLALEFAAAQWEDIEGVVLSASFIANPLPPWLNMARSLLGTTLFKKPPPEIFLKKFMLGQDGSRPLVESLMDCIKSVRPDVLAQRLNAIVNVDAERQLRECKAPILYLLGKEDQAVADRGWKAIEKVRPDVALVELDAPHMVLQTRPREVLKAIDLFVAELEKNRDQLFAESA